MNARDGDGAGDRSHSANRHVAEQFTLVDDDTIRYRATIEGREVLTQPWTI